MNNQKSKIYNQTIINYLIENEMVTVKQLSDKTGLTEKTVRSKIDYINDYLMENDLGIIKKKTRIGIWLDATNEQKQKLFQYFVDSRNDIEIGQSDALRVSNALRYIFRINKNNTLTTKQLASYLYLSVPTTLKVLSNCREWLQLFNVDLLLIRNKGIELVGSDSCYRLALKHFITKFDSSEDIDFKILYFMPGLNLDKIKKIIIETENEWSFEFAEESFNEILVFVCLAIYHNSIKNTGDLGLAKEEISLLQQYNEYNFASAIFKKVTESFSIPIVQQEIAFLSVQILCSKLIDTTNYQASAKQMLQTYDNILTDFVRRIIHVVSDVLNVDLTKDETLFKGLLVHLKPAIFRLRYNRGNANQLTSYIKTEYKQTFRVSWIVSVLFEEYFNLTITEDELGFIVLYIQAALERNKAPINAILVSKNGMGINQMLIDKVERTFPQVSLTKVFSPHDFNPDLIAENTLVITTVKLEKNDARVVEVDDLLSKISVDKLEQAIKLMLKDNKDDKVNFDTSCHQFFEPDLIFPHVKVGNKTELIKMMTDKLVSKGYVTEKYLTSVLEREKLTPTSIGNGIAVPHGEPSEINEARVAIATLDQPILWDTDYCDIIFLLVVKMDNEYEISRTQLFYKEYVRLIETDEKVNQLKQFEKNTDFYKFLVQ